MNHSEGRAQRHYGPSMPEVLRVRSRPTLPKFQFAELDRVKRLPKSRRLEIARDILEASKR